MSSRGRASRTTPRAHRVAKNWMRERTRRRTNVCTRKLRGSGNVRTRCHVRRLSTRFSQQIDQTYVATPSKSDYYQCVISHAYFLLTIRAVAMSQDAMIAASSRAPKDRHLPLLLHDAIINRKVIDGLLDLEVTYVVTTKISVPTPHTAVGEPTRESGVAFHCLCSQVIALMSLIKYQHWSLQRRRRI